MPFSIIMSRGEGAQTDVRDVAGAILRIGRGPDNDMQLDDDAVQPNHATIQEVSGVYILRDLGDGTQTLVNDKPVKEVILTVRGTIRIGSYLLQFSRPGQAAPLRIEGKRLKDVFAADDDTAPAATLVLPQSPFAAKTVPGDPDATQPLQPITEPHPDDPDKTKVIPPPGSPPS